MSLLHPDDEGRQPAVISRSTLRLMALVNVISIQLAVVAGVGAWLVLQDSVPGVAARVTISFAVALIVGTTVFWRVSQKWSRRES